MTPTLRAAAGRPRVRVTLGAAAVLMLVGLVVAVLVAALGPRGSSVSLSQDPAPAGVDAGDGVAPSPGGAIFVHLLGAVERPGLYELRAGDRGIDAVAAAGGFTDAADQSQLNLARPLSDGEQIHVPALGEAPLAPPGGAAGAPSGGAAAGGAAAGGKVNLNTADLQALDTLPGVGPATARSILDWREANGRFTAVEDLLGVTGIGEKTLEALRDLVTV